MLLLFQTIEIFPEDEVMHPRSMHFPRAKSKGNSEGFLCREENFQPIHIRFSDQSGEDSQQGHGGKRGLERGKSDMRGKRGT